MENGLGKCFLFSRIPNEAGRGAGGGKCMLIDGTTQPLLIHGREKKLTKIVAYAPETVHCTSIMNFAHPDMHTCMYMNHQIATRCCTLLIIYVTM